MREPCPGHDDTVIELTTDEFHAAARRALASAGLTYRQLADQARRRAFDSDQANMLWCCIGDTLPDDFT